MFVNDNMYILIFAGLGLIILLYLMYYYIHNMVDREISVLKKKIKKLSKSEDTPSKRLEFTRKSENYEGTECDSYFDPMKSEKNIS